MTWKAVWNVTSPEWNRSSVIAMEHELALKQTSYLKLIGKKHGPTKYSLFS